jgi:hypothetical protein
MNVSLCNLMTVCIWECNTASNSMLFDVSPQQPFVPSQGVQYWLHSVRKHITADITVFQ